MTPRHKPDFHDLMSAVGLFLLRWGIFEQALNGAPLPEEARAVRQMRNTLCQGLEAASADPASGLEPWVRCRAFDGERRTYTLSDLHAGIALLERLSRPAVL